MRLHPIALLLILTLAAPLASAAEFIPLSSPVPAAEMVDIGVTTRPDGSVQIEYDLVGFHLDPIEIDGGRYYRVELGGEAHFIAAGEPELPHIARSIAIPDLAEMEARVVSSSYREFTGVDVVPSKGNLTRNVNPATVAYEFGASYYDGSWYPQSIVTLGEPYIMRELRGQVVDLQPFQYDAASQTLRVYDHVVIEVTPVGVSTVNTIDRAAESKTCRQFEAIYADQFINFADLGGDRYPPNTEVGEMIVIAYDAYVPSMQPFVDWKNQMGIPTTLFAKSEVGSSGSDFLTFIQDYYDANELAFILLVGDAAQIPYPLSSGAPADPMYALLAGSDNYPDAFVGRLSAESVADVELQVQKFIDYERYPDPSGNWYHMGTGIGSAEGSGIGDDGEADWEHINNIRADLLGFTFNYVDQIYDPGASASQVATAVNQGRSVINYCGHGSMTAWSTTGFSSSNVNQLSNHNMLPWIISVACVNGKFHSGTCFAEAWLRADDSGQPTGAVGMYASTVNMSWAPPMAAQDETADLLVAGEKRTFGALCFSGSCQMMDEYGYGGVSEFKNWHIFGDPSLRVRTDTPLTLDVLHDESIEADATSLTVTVTGQTGALCGLSADGVFLGSAFTDHDGNAEIAIEGMLGEAVTLTVTDFNAVPYEVEIPVQTGPQPAIEISPDSFDVVMDIDAYRTETLFISNIGEAGSELGYSVQITGMGATEPWITVRPPRGNVVGGETAEVDVTFNTNPLQYGVYHAVLTVSALDEEFDVPIVLQVGDASAVDGRDVAQRLTLRPAQPNPFSGATQIAFDLPQAGDVRLGVYDMNGRLVRTLAAGTRSAGAHRATWDGRDDAGRDVPGGVYFYRLDVNGERLADKVMMLN